MFAVQVSELCFCRPFHSSIHIKFFCIFFKTFPKCSAAECSQWKVDFVKKKFERVIPIVENDNIAPKSLVEIQ